MTLPRVNLNLLVATVAILGTGAILYAVIRNGKSVAQAVSDTAAAAADAVDPTNPNNIAATVVNKIGAAVTGNASWSLGSAAADVTDTSGQIAVAPSYPKNVFILKDYFATVDQEDADMAPAPGFGSVQFVSNGGGAATGRTTMKK